jgi:hypothetical protein
MSSLTFHYEPIEDRILAVINAGETDTAGCWLTRRMTLTLIDHATPYLDRMSPVISKTPGDMRAELAAMERQVALARTADEVTRTPTESLIPAAATADLVMEVTIAREGEWFALVLRGRNGMQASLTWSRDHLQRIVVMLEELAAKAGWREGGQSGATIPTQKPANVLRN